MGVTQSTNTLLPQLPCRSNRLTQPPVIRGTSKLQYPTRHRDGNPITGELAYERVIPFPGIDPCDKYARARFNISASCSNKRMRLLASRSSAEPVDVIPGFTPSSMSAFFNQVDNVIG